MDTGVWEDSMGLYYGDSDVSSQVLGSLWIVCGRKSKALLVCIGFPNRYNQITSTSFVTYDSAIHVVKTRVYNCTL